jgi:uncharacterized protein
MGIVAQLQKAKILAYKNKDALTKDIVSYILSQIKNKEIELQKELTDAECVQVMKKEIKTRNETVTFLRAANKEKELHDEELKIAFLQQFLPTPYTHDEIKAIVQKVVLDNGIIEPQKEQWRIKGYVMQHYADRTDPGLLHTVILSLYS